MNEEKSEQALQAGTAGWGTSFASRLPVWGVLAAFFTTAMISYSLRVGRLLAAPTYDDVNYLVDAARRIYVLDSTDVLGLIKYWVQNPPHSPGETLLAMTGFFVFGVHDWAGYAANSLVILGLLLGADLLLKGLRLSERIAIAVFLLSVPIAGISVTEFRPDCAAGLATAMAILLTLREGGLSTLRRQVGVGALWAGALLMKPSVFPLTLGLAAMSLAFHIAIQWQDKRVSLRQAIRRRTWLPVVAVALLLAAPHYITASRHILSYIHVNVIGADREVWFVPGDWAAQLLYFWNGTGGQLMLYRHIWILTPLLLLGATVILWRRDRMQTMRLLSITLMMAAAYVVPSVNPVKNYFFTASFDFLLMLCAAMVLGGMFRTVCRNKWMTTGVRLIALSVIVIAFLPARGPEGMFGRGTTRATEAVLVLQRVQQQIDETIHRNRGEKPPVLFCTTGGYADASSIAFMSLARGQELITHVAHTDTDLAAYRRYMMEANFILATEPGTGFVHEWLPSAKLQEQTLAMAREMKEFVCIAEIPALHGKRYFIFARKEPF